MKKGVSLVSFLLSVPLSSAQYYAAGQQSPGLITEGFSFLFGQSSNEIVLKLGLFILLIAVFKAGFAKLKLFEENPNMNMVLGAILSLIAIKFMPVEFSSGLGTLIWVAALFVLPYLLVGMFVENKIWRAVLALLGVAGIYYFISGGIGLYGSRYPYLGFIRGNEIFDDIYYKTTSMGWLVPLLLVAALIFLIYLIMKGGGTDGKGGAWSRWRDRVKELKIARQPTEREEIAARARENVAFHERMKAETEAYLRREAEEAKINAEEKEVRQHKRAQEAERVRQDKAAEEEKLRREKEARQARRFEEERQRKEKAEAKKLRKFESSQAAKLRKHEAEEEDKKRQHELELERTRQQARRGDIQEPASEPPRHPIVPRREAPSAREEEDPNRLGQRRIGLIRRIRSRLGWQKADRPEVPLNIRRTGLYVPPKTEQYDKEGTEIDRGMEERMRRVRMQRMRQLQNQKEMSRREEEELQSLITEFNPNQDRAEEEDNRQAAEKDMKEHLEKQRQRQMEIMQEEAKVRLKEWKYETKERPQPSALKGKYSRKLSPEQKQMLREWTAENERRRKNKQRPLPPPKGLYAGRYKKQ